MCKCLRTHACVYVEKGGEAGSARDSKGESILGASGRARVHMHVHLFRCMGHAYGGCQCLKLSQIVSPTPMSQHQTLSISAALVYEACISGGRQESLPVPACGLVDHGNEMSSRLVVLHIASVDKLQPAAADQVLDSSPDLIALLAPPAHEEGLRTLDQMKEWHCVEHYDSAVMQQVFSLYAYICLGGAGKAISPASCAPAG